MKDILKNLPPLKDSVRIQVAAVSRYNDFQVEIRDSGSNLLIWRAWDFEPDFEFNLNQQVQLYKK
jgi:Bacterial protein of unknown function (DUF905).